MKSIKAIALLAVSCSAFASEDSMTLNMDTSNYTTLNDRLADYNNCQGTAYAKRSGSGMIHTDEIKVRCYPEPQTPEPSFWSVYDVPMDGSMAAILHKANVCVHNGGKANIYRDEDSWSTKYIVKCNIVQ
ncbi:hypothetical protein MYOV003v1_p0016 [Vibrio phage 207E48.1]|nr:hypothetical protein MYOV003v1_p0016 [Vibrio phage 207E48.1]